MDVSPPQRFTLHALCHSPYQVVSSNPTFCNLFYFCLAGFQIARSHAPEAPASGSFPARSTNFWASPTPEAPASGPHQHQKCQLLNLPAQNSSRSSNFWMAPDVKPPEAPASRRPGSRVSRSSSFWTLFIPRSTNFWTPPASETSEAPASGCLQQRNF